jgi:hypothetical protein
MSGSGYFQNNVTADWNWQLVYKWTAVGITLCTYKAAYYRPPPFSPSLNILITPFQEGNIYLPL